jgi:hypothetical protein
MCPASSKALLFSPPTTCAPTASRRAGRATRGAAPRAGAFSARLRELLAQEHNGKDIAGILAERLLKDALSGKLGHVKEVLDRTEGAARQTVEVQAGERDRDPGPARGRHRGGD